MKVLVLNAGSSSLRYALIDPSSGAKLLEGNVERIGTPECPTHQDAFSRLLERFEEAELPGPDAVGHRVVHGGRHFSRPALITPEVVATIEDCVPLAPLHNPPALAGIAGAMATFPDVPQVAVFDTAFHRTIPAQASTYAIDTEVAREYDLRRYGFHGTSHEYVAGRAARFLERPLSELRIVTLHIGNGASACAIRGGESVDTSMGVTPLEGLVMGTRSGDLDPAIPGILLAAGWDATQVDELLSRRSGLKGLAGNNDVREVHQAAENGDAAALLARDVMAYRIKKYLASYIGVLDGVEAVVWTAGVGEHYPWLRAEVADGLTSLGLMLDPDRNDAAVHGEIARISADDSPVEILVVPTDEEFAIAEQTAAVISA